MHSNVVSALLMGLVLPGIALAHAGHGAPEGHVHAASALVPVLLLVALGWIIRRRLRSKGADPAG